MGIHDMSVDRDDMVLNDEFSLNQSNSCYNWPIIFQGCESTSIHDAAVDRDGMVLTVEGEGPVSIPLMAKQRDKAGEVSIADLGD